MNAPLVPSGASPPAREELERPGHGSLHGTVTRSVLGAATGALLADLACRLGGGSVESSKLFMLLVAAGAFVGVASRGRRWLAGAIGGGLGIVGSVAAGLAAQWAPFSAALFGVAAAPVLGEGESVRRKMLTGVVAGAFGYAGLHVGQVLLQTGVFSSLVPGPLAAAAAGASAGLFIGLASAPRHLLPEPDPVEQAFKPALAARDGELHGLLTRALDIYRVIRDESRARGDKESLRLIGEVSGQVLRVLRISEHCRRIEAELSEDAADRLGDRVAQLDRKLAEASDASVRATYAQARASLEEQAAALSRLDSGRERVVARLHVDVTLLEKLKLSLLQLRSADAVRYGAESRSVLDALDELSREIDATSEAVNEVFGMPDGPAPKSLIGPQPD